MTTIYNADFADIKESIKLYFENSPVFNSYNFEGSAITEIIDIFSLIEQNATFYLNNTANELFVQTAIQNKNIYKNARKLNYFPKRKSASYIEVTFSTASVDKMIPAYSEFTMGAINLVLSENVILNSSNSWTATAQLYEGELITETAIVNTTDLFSVTLQENYIDIDNDHVYVYVDVLTGGSYPESANLWTNSDNDIIETNSNSYLTNFTDTSYTIQFDDGRIFNVPNLTDRVRVKYLKTTGSSVNGTTGTITTTISGLTVSPGSNVLVNGLDEESVESIKLKASAFNSTQNRAVTERDWNAIVKRYSYYDIFKDCFIWGGENEFVDTLLSDTIIETPETYRNLGRVVISSIRSNYDFLTTTEQTNLLNFCELYKIAGLRLRFLHPNIYTITPTVSIKTSLSLSFSQTSFETTINDYLDTLEGFDQNFYKSKLIKLIDTQNAISYSDVSFTTKMKVKNESYKVIRIGSAITPSTLLGTVDGLTLNDNGSGVIRYDSIDVGTINYTTGFIIMNSALSTVPDYEFSFSLVSDLSANSIRESIFKFEDIVIVNL